MNRQNKLWLAWGLIVSAVAAAFIVFNYQGSRDAVPLSEIFPDEEVFPVDVEYEFVKDETPPAPTETVPSVSREIPAAVPAPAQTVSVDPAAANKAPAEKAPAYTIQIASFKDRKKAEKALEEIRVKVPSAYIASRDLGEKGVWYRIYAGQFELRSDAEVTLSDIRQNYNSSFIISPTKIK